MAAEIVNLTQQVVIRAIEDVLEQYPSHPHQQAFAHPELRQQLVVYVLNHAQNHFTLTENHSEMNESMNAEVSEALSQDSPEIKAIVQQGIEVIMQEQADWIEQHVPEQQKPN